MKKSLLWLIIPVLCLTGCSMDEVYDNVQENEKFTILEDVGYADEYGIAYYIEGTIKNNTSKQYSYVQVQFNVYDESGNIIGSCLDNVNNLEGEGTWKFKAICSGEASEIKSYKLTEFSSF